MISFLKRPFLKERIWRCSNLLNIKFGGWESSEIIFWCVSNEWLVFLRCLVVMCFRNSSMKFIRFPYALHCICLYLKQNENRLYLRTNSAFQFSPQYIFQRHSVQRSLLSRMIRMVAFWSKKVRWHILLVKALRGQFYCNNFDGFRFSKHVSVKYHLLSSVGNANIVS